MGLWRLQIIAHGEELSVSVEAFINAIGLSAGADTQG